MFLVTEEEVRLLWNMFCGIKSAVLKIKMLTIWKDSEMKRHAYQFTKFYEK